MPEMPLVAPHWPGYTSGSPVVTSNGTDPSTAIVWVVGATGSSGTNGRAWQRRSHCGGAAQAGS